jgi:hypothetical protein
VAEALQTFSRTMSAPKIPIRDDKGRIVQVVTDTGALNG